VAIINDTFARQYFPNEDPIGHRIRRRGWLTIVGVVGSVKHQQPMNAPVPMVYSPYTLAPDPGMWVTIRTEGDPQKLAVAVRGTVRALDPDLAVLKLRPMRQVVADSLVETRLIASFVAGFAGFALVLAAIGLYGVIAYSVSQRTHEIGVRIALGASSGDILALVLKKGALLAGAGIAIGVPGALAGSQILKSLLYGISPRDATVFIGVPLALVLVALAASYIPARRAARVGPIVALRQE
jgi:predicted permease